MLPILNRPAYRSLILGMQFKVSRHVWLQILNNIFKAERMRKPGTLGLFCLGLLSVFLLAGCMQGKAEHSVVSAPDAREVLPRIQKTSDNVFPEAAIVKPCFGNIDLTITHDGKVRNGPEINLGVRTQIYGPVDVGKALTSQEINELRQNIFLDRQPDVENTCIIPLNYAFLFYNSSGHFLGYFAFSLAPEYAQIYPLPHTQVGLTYVSFNKPIIEAILKAQHLLVSQNRC